jgi:hypothetical protein
MSEFAFGLLGFVLFFLLTAGIGGVLDLPHLGPFRSTLADRRVKPFAVLVALTPAVSAVVNLPAKLASLATIPTAVASTVSLTAGAFFTAALTGCWLGLDESPDPHSRPGRSVVIAFVVLIADAVLLHYLKVW